MRNSVLAGPRSRDNGMGSGTPSLREAKPDPMPAADRGWSALPEDTTEDGILEVFMGSLRWLDAPGHMGWLQS